MASEGEANKARRAHGNVLTRKGAHAIGVEPGQAYGHAGWVVVAHVEPGKKVDLPSELAAPDDGKTVSVPLVVRRSASFVPE